MAVVGHPSIRVAGKYPSIGAWRMTCTTPKSSRTRPRRSASIPSSPRAAPRRSPTSGSSGIPCSARRPDRSRSSTTRSETRSRGWPRSCTTRWGSASRRPRSGRCSALLVYRVEHDSPINVLINPELEWSGKEKEWMEEGCLSLPRVHVEVERPIHVRVQGAGRCRRADHDRGVRARGAGHPARDGPPRRRPDRRPRPARPAQGGHARPARSGRGRRVAARAHRLPRHLGFAARVLERLAETPHRPVLVVTRPDRPAGRGRKLTAPPVADVARALGLDLDQPEDVNAPEAVARIAEAAPDVVIVCAFGAIIEGAAAQRVRAA